MDFDIIASCKPGTMTSNFDKIVYGIAGLFGVVHSIAIAILGVSPIWWVVPGLASIITIVSVAIESKGLSYIATAVNCLFFVSLAAIAIDPWMPPLTVMAKAL